VTVKEVASAFDAASGTFTMTLSGTANLRWQQLDKGRSYLLDGLEAPKLPEFGRKDGPDKDLPVLVPPLWFTGRMTILLPDGGKGFTVAGTDIDRKVGGMTITRKARVEGDRMTVDYEWRAVRPEIEAAEARDALGAATDIARSRLFLVAGDYSISAEERAGIAANQPKTVNALLDRGNQFIDRGEYALAVAEMDAALRIDPKNARAVANRGIAKYWLDDLEGAGADFDTAAKLNPKEVVWMRGRGLLALRRADHSSAVASFSQALELDPADRFSLYRRAEALVGLEKVDGALTDIGALLDLGEDPINLHRWRADILIAAGRSGEALASLDKLVSDHPTDPAVRLLRASALAAADRDAEAVREYDAVLKMKPSVMAYINRARLMEKRNPAAALADAASALALDPDNENALEYRAERLIEAKQAAAAVALLDDAVTRKPDTLSLRLVRATARVKSGNAATAIEDVLAAKKMAATPIDLNEICWWGATRDQALEIALRACDEALAKRPDAAAFHDSRALVLLRLNRLQDALAAYDRALSLAPDLPAALYGRSLVKARLNDMDGSNADRAAAIASYKDIAEDFEEYRIPTYKPGAAQTGTR
jgi:tetratricopeptide (TPR) repeat protein